MRSVARSLNSLRKEANSGLGGLYMTVMYIDLCFWVNDIVRQSG